MSRLKDGTVVFAWPLAQHIVTAGWLYNNNAFHGALDFRAAVGTPVYAAEDGKVDFTYTWNGKVTKGDTNSYGNLVRLRHADYKGKSALYTYYAHLSKIMVKAGQQVKEGQLIGYSGNTGNCQGAHLHFEVRCGGLNSGARCNPLNWLDDDFTCADKQTEQHLGKYFSARVRQQVTVEMHPSSATLKIGPMSAGDEATVRDLATKLKLNIVEV